MMRRAFASLVALLLTLLSTRQASAGYSHYWRWHARPDPAALGRCVDDMSRIVEARRELLADEQGRTQAQAVFRSTQIFGDAGTPLPEIHFNGIGDAGHEAFGFPLAPFTAAGDPGFQFVKTAAKPYDEVVVACLLTARDCFPGETLSLSSDGQWPSSFLQGAALYERVLGRKARNPFVTPTDLVAKDPPPASASARPSETGKPGGAATTDARPEPRAVGARKRMLLGVILFLALAIAFVLTREAK